MEEAASLCCNPQTAQRSRNPFVVLQFLNREKCCCMFSTNRRAVPRNSVDRVEQLTWMHVHGSDGVYTVVLVISRYNDFLSFGPRNVSDAQLYRLYIVKSCREHLSGTSKAGYLDVWDAYACSDGTFEVSSVIESSRLAQSAWCPYHASQLCQAHSSSTTRPVAPVCMPHLPDAISRF